MTEGTENLVLEHLRAIRGDMGRMWDAMRTIQAEMTSMRRIMSGIVTLQDNDHDDIASLKARVDPIERRLELAD